MQLVNAALHTLFQKCGEMRFVSVSNCVFSPLLHPLRLQAAQEELERKLGESHEVTAGLEEDIQASHWYLFCGCIVSLCYV